MVTVAVYARGRDEPGQALDELEGGEQDLGAAVDVRFGEPVEETAVGRG